MSKTMLTKAILGAAFAAFLIAPIGVSTVAHAAAAAPQASPAQPNGGASSKCASITDPVKKEQCLKQEQGK